MAAFKKLEEIVRDSGLEVSVIVQILGTVVMEESGASNLTNEERLNFKRQGAFLRHIGGKMEKTKPEDLFL